MAFPKATRSVSPCSLTRVAGSRCTDRRSSIADCSTTNRWDFTLHPSSSWTVRGGALNFSPFALFASGELCTIEENGDVRLGLNYVKGLHRDKAAWLVTERNLRAFTSLEDLLTRVPLNKTERRVLAKIGALNLLSEHRRTALWDVEAVFDSDDLFSGESLEGIKPLQPMTGVERLQADFDGTRTTTGPHTMTFMRETTASRHTRLRSGQRKARRQGHHRGGSHLPPATGAPRKAMSLSASKTKPGFPTPLSEPSFLKN